MASESFERRLVAIFSADVVGYSRLMAADDLDTIRRITACRRMIREAVERHGGRVVDDPGDNVLAELPSATETVRCALAIQLESADQNAGVPPDRRMELRIGIELGDVMAESGRIYGGSVNAAARLEALSDPGGLCISEIAHRGPFSRRPERYPPERVDGTGYRT